jgi:uncharacterized protein YigE (DUF2233 family)
MGFVERHQVLVALALFAVPLAVVAQAAPSTRAQIDAVRCDAQTSAAPTLRWRGDVVQRAIWSVRLGEHGVRNQLIVVRVPAARVRFTLEIARTGGVMRPWSLSEAPADAAIAVNAGQFTDAGPWGWVVHKQHELQPPGVGPLAGAFVVDSLGTVAILTADELSSWRAPRRALEAVQSYPMLLTDSARAPGALCDVASGIDLEHRDARLAVGITRDAQVLIVLSRFELPGGGQSRVPIGPTTPEMAEIMRRLGAERAMMLDGGLSAQMLVRTAAGTVQWPGLRSVPLALVARLRQ